MNELVAGGGRRGAGREYEVVPYIFIGPKRRRALGEIAGRVYREHHAGLRALKAPDFFFLHRLLGPGEPHAADLLSYVFFDRDFVDAAINLGRRDATNRLRAAYPFGSARRAERATRSGLLRVAQDVVLRVVVADRLGVGAAR